MRAPQPAGRFALRRIVYIALLVCLLAGTAAAEGRTGGSGNASAPAAVSLTGREVVSTYESETLTCVIEPCEINRTQAYLTTITMADPGRQIRKASSPFHVRLAEATDLAKQIPQAAVVINGSGYVSPGYPEIPANYPGTGRDYYYTPLGSLTITDGEVLRCLEGVPYYGLTLEKDGLHMYVGADNEEVLSHHPTQTWAFYDGCPLIRDGESILDRSWDWAARHAVRNIIARIDDHTVLVLTIARMPGADLMQLTDLLVECFHPEWAFNLDGGPSATLIRRRSGEKYQKLIFGARQKIVDIMAFVEAE